MVKKREKDVFEKFHINSNGDKNQIILIKTEKQGGIEDVKKIYVPKNTKRNG